MKLRIKEGIKQIDSGIYITDYVGDVVNLLINKPKPYRLVWNKIDDVYGIGDAYKYIHGNIEDAMLKQGYGNEDLYKSTNIDKTHSEFTFVPYGNVDNSWEVGGFVGERNSTTYIPSGIILTNEDLQQDVPDLYNKLKRNKLLNMDITKIEKILTNYAKELQHLRNEEKRII